MTARTLEEIEREIAKLGSQKWYGAAHTLRLLAIAQEQRAEIARRPRVGSCVWVSLDADGDTRIWSTGCKQEWIFYAGGPQENGVRFCPHCGAEAEIEVPEDID